MPVPDLQPLLDRLDGTFHAERVRTLAVLGRDHAGDATLGHLLDGLSTQSWYHHELALVAATAAGDRDRLRRALSHPSPRIRSYVLAHLAGADLAPEEILELLLNGSADDRRLLRRFINRNGLTEVAEAVIDTARRELGDREAATLLPGCSGDTVRRLLPELRYAMPSLRPLARRHPAVLLDYVDGELRGLSRGLKDRFWTEMGSAVAEMALAEPDRTLRLIEDLGPSWVLPWGVPRVLGHLIRFAPSRLARLIATDEFARQNGWRVPTSLCRNSTCFSDADRVAMARVFRERESMLFTWIGSFPPSERADLFARSLDDIDSTNKTWLPESLDVLPHEIRHVEARRILALRQVRISEVLTLEYTAFLPLAEAREALGAEAGRAKAEDRALGYDLLISCARRERSRDAIAEVLRSCGRLRNEQDPVRFRAVRALAGVRPSTFGDDHLEDLQTLVTAVVEARDTSSATRRELANIGFALLGDAVDDPTGARFQFALGTLERLAGARGSFSFPRLDRVLRRGAERHLIDSLMPRVEREASVDRYGLAISLAESLRKRAWGHAGLQDVLERATRAANDSTVRRAVGLWLGDPRARAERVARVIAGDESTVALPVVLTTLVRSRQDLLDVLLGTRPLKGRFLKGNVRYVPVISGGFERWLPRQCQAYRAALDSLIATPATTEGTKLSAIRALGRLPQIGADALSPYLAASDVPVQEAALHGLAWTDQPERVLARLVDDAGTDRARVAVYAATRCARFVPRAEVESPLRNLLNSDGAKVTAKKEAARLLGTLRPRGAVDVLIGAFGAESAHRDVRVAIGRSLRGSLDDDRVWPILAGLSSGTDDEARSLLDTTAGQLPPRHRARYAELVLGLSGSMSQRVRASAFVVLGSWARWSSQAAAAVRDAIEDLGAGPEWQWALQSLGVMLADSTGWQEAVDLVATLNRRADPGELDAGAERDLPSAQRLSSVVHEMANLSFYVRADHRHDLHRVADALGGGLDAMTVRLAAADWNDPMPVFAAVGRHMDAHPLLAPAAMTAAGRALTRDEPWWGVGTLGPAADDLIGEGSLGTGALALELVESAGARFDWPVDWRGRLRALRSHPSPDVASLARRIWTAQE